ncbi:MAG: S41 family peptidase [Pseudomonadota bacterium]|nr:S41 family peptidase [Pseudomonadota bacterium]
MKTNALVLLAVLCVSKTSFANSVNCSNEFTWLKATFESNDAGFHYAVSKKGTNTYESHNASTAESVKKAKNLEQCHVLLREWLSFFRSGHIGLSVNTPALAEQAYSTEIHTFDLPAFKTYLENKNEEDLEGIWHFSSYTVALRQEGKESDVLKGYIIDSSNPDWQVGQVKLEIHGTDNDNLRAVFYMGDHSANHIDSITQISKNAVMLGNNFIVMSRQMPRQQSEPDIQRYVRLLQAEQASFERISDKTVLLRIPSFNHANKAQIDAVIAKNQNLINNTQNLIIDIRGNGGGSDASYASLLPIIYTNPITTVGVEFLSTPLNNARMKGFIDHPHLSEEEKQWAKSGFDVLQQNVGEFVNLDDAINVETFDTVQPFPSNVAVLIDENNGSTAEQFLLAAKQSKKVKLFGRTTAGVLDISNMHQATSPSGHYTLHYGLSKSLRIPHMAIDDKGIQPDFYFNDNVENHKWISNAQLVLEAGVN